MVRRDVRLAFAAAALLQATACSGRSTEGKPPADLDGTWFGRWDGEDEFEIPISSGFWFVLDHDEDSDLVTGTAFSSLAGPGTVSGDVDGSRFALEVVYDGGATETYRAGMDFGTVSDGRYDGTIGGEVYDGDFFLYPAELAQSGTNNNPGLVSGRILTGDGTVPVNGAEVSIGVGEDRLVAITNANGDYSFPFVPGGPRVLVVPYPGAQTAYVPFVVNGTVTMPNVDLDPATNPGTVPVISLASAIDGQATNATVVFAEGTLTAIDAPFVVASVNGAEYLVPLTAGSFDYALILSRGVNRVVFQAANQVGITERTALVNADVAPQKIRVTAVWDQGTPTAPNDQDLHVWQHPIGGGNGNHAFFAQPNGIPNGVLDVDNVVGFGPENFTMPAAPEAKYYVAVNFFDGSVTSNVIVGVSLNEGTPDERHYAFGPRLMTQPNQGAGYPVTASTDSWWRVADVVVDAAGLASLAPAPNPDTAFPLNP